MVRTALGPVFDGAGKAMISVIIPVRNEERLLGKCLQSVLDQPEAAEIIVVDGASSDRSVEIARRFGVKVLTMEKPCLAGQMNRGARAAAGDILLFLHADATLNEGCLLRLGGLGKKVVGGSFTMQVEGDRLFYKILSLGGNIYCRLTRTYFGDRGIFVRRETFQRLDGYRNMPVMTDVDFSRRMKRLGKTTILSGPILTSSRKFEDESPWLTLYLIFYALFAFHMGVDPEKIQTKYYSK